jgi:CheY-like chemotaxis protein
MGITENNAYLERELHPHMKNIFLAEDDADDRMFFEDALKAIKIPSQLTLSSNGLELISNLETLTAHPPPDVIFLDLNMPFKSGIECLKEIRETPKLKDIPVVIFSTTANLNAVESTYSLGANAYFCKPNSHQLLIKTIEAVLKLNLWEQNQQLPRDKFVLEIS